ncbi:MAG: alpha-amylase, partial [Bacteroidales bacterium]|nr:alpha-amylase [Bacteroidales bacterium]
GSDLGRSNNKMKLAGAVLLTSPGKPFIYQGEELGYWGKKENGDEYIRTPIKWTKDGKVPTSALNGKYDRSMLTADISVEAQNADNESVLSVYKKFAKARNTNDALANGTMAEVTSNNNAVAMWTMTSDNEKVLVVHNFCGTTVSATITGYKVTDCLVSNGSITVNGGNLTLGAYASAVYKQ